MTIAQFKDLCLDVNDPALARFWQAALGAPLTELDGGDARVDPAPGRPAGETIWINRVPEPRTGPTRVHLNLRLDEPDPRRLLEAGAHLVREPGDDPWWALTDPEGNEFWAFPPLTTGPTPAPAFEFVTGSADPVVLASWWAQILGGTVEPDAGSASLTGAAGFPWQRWIFTEVDEPKTVKNRLHWDVDLTGPDPAALVDAGATVLRDRGGDIRWWVLADPGGNEFCAFAPR
ncbi:hypothetical protein SAMN05444365_102109 [Micromonospora pattaloongensis]|uniref:Glyoxalase-like domain-containing protein n=1 Tax=Micromonospora pattaloongensis TaxID=405436 RepID=A0A1H3JII9_9ACTN|nr:VOC family protein [Micromonospora pattaloongensis]SDY39044.1 hypothetical protein SAMN05444365_102109 [Micromonospora pattaloongensis]